MTKITRRSPRLMSPVLLICLSISPLTRAATIQTTDPKPLTGSLTIADDTSLTIATTEKDSTILPLADIVEITLASSDRTIAAKSTSSINDNSLAPPTPATTSATTENAIPVWHLELADGDQFSAAISAWTDAHITCLLDAFKGGSLTVSSDSVRALWAGKGTNDPLVTKAKALGVTAQAQDVAFVQKDGDVKAVAGLVTGMDATALHFKFEGEDHTIKLERLVGILFAHRDAVPEKKMYATFTLLNQDTLSGKIASLADGTFHITPLLAAGDNTTLDISMNDILKIQSRNGRVTWVDELAPASISQNAYLDRQMPYQVNHSLTGGPLKLIDGNVARGLAVHSRCVLTYDISGGYERFRTKLGFEQPDGKIGRAAVRVLGDDKVLWKDADLRGDAKTSSALDLPLAGVKTLTLEVDYGKNFDVGDRVIWGDARIIKPATN